MSTQIDLFLVIRICGWLQDGLAQERMKSALASLDYDYCDLSSIGDLFGDISNQQVPEQWFVRCSDHDQFTFTILRVYQDRV